MYGNDSGMLNNDNNNTNPNPNTNTYGTYNQDMSNNMTSNGNPNNQNNNMYNDYNNNNNQNYNNGNGNYNNYNSYNEEQPNYNQGTYNDNLSFGGFDDNRTGSKKKFNKWLLLIPIIIVFILLIIILLLVSSANKYTVNTKNITFIIGESEPIKVTAKEKVKNKLTYSSENAKVASVDDSGNVTGVGVGTTNIWVGINGKKSKKVSVLVNTNKTELIFKEESITLEKDGTHQLVIKNVLSDDVFTWSSNNELIATVDETGLVTGVHAGTTKIVVTESDGRKSSATVTVTSDEVLVDTIVLTDQTIGIGETRQLQPMISPANALKILTWKSNKESIVSVDNTGKITGLSEGRAIITATTHDGKSAKATIIVDPKAASSVKINGCVKSLKVGDRISLTAIVAPATANQSVKWSSSNSNILSVSGTSVTAKGKGTATITATTNDGKTATCTISVGSMAVNSLKMNTVQLTLKQGSTRTLSVAFNPTSAKDFYTVKWSSSNNNVARVDQNGVVTAVGPGDARITASAGGKKATAAVTVERTSASSLNITNCPSSILVNQSYTLKARSDYSSARIKWSSNNTSIATVSSSGVVKGVRTGTVVITAETDNGLETTCTIQVTDGLSLSGCPSGNITAGNSVTLTANSLSGSTVIWSSSNQSVATVAGGKVTTKAVGTTTITATAGGKSTTCTIKVVKPSITKINAISAQTLTVGQTKAITITTNLTATQMTTFYTKNDLTFTYANKGYVTATSTASNKFNLKGVKKGSTTVYAKIGGKSYGFKVTVK